MKKLRLSFIALILTAVVVHPAAQPAAPHGAAASYDQVLDLYVRDGYVYYRALKAERAKLDAFVSSLAEAPPQSASKSEQIAFWLNAYDALVLKTIVDHYPMAQHSTQYPAHSIRQIPGAFETNPHHVGGRTLTLDQIEQTVLAGFKDPRLFLAIGRGSVGGGRLRSEAYTAERLEEQLKEVAAECVNRTQCVQIEREQNRMTVSSIFSWRANDFIEAYADKAPKLYSERSPIERAVIAFVAPRLLTTEREVLEQNQFKMTYRPFDWSLNDLTGRGGR